MGLGGQKYVSKAHPVWKALVNASIFDWDQEKMNTRRKVNWSSMDCNSVLKNLCDTKNISSSNWIKIIWVLVYPGAWKKKKYFSGRKDLKISTVFQIQCLVQKTRDIQAQKRDNIMKTIKTCEKSHKHRRTPDGTITRHAL